MPLALALLKPFGRQNDRLSYPAPADAVAATSRLTALGMGLEMLSMTLFWTWNAVQPGLQPAPVAVVVPSKVILQASWIEPLSMRDETSPPVIRQPAKTKKTARHMVLSGKMTKKSQKPLWDAAKSWELPPILWAGFIGFLAAGLGLVSLLKYK